MRNNVKNNAKQRRRGNRPGGVTGRGFMPGQSGNPDGRPRTRGLLNGLRARLAEALPDGRSVEQALIDVLVQEALRGKHRLQAIAIILDRLEGKATVRVEVDEKKKRLQERSKEELEYFLFHGYWPEEEESVQFENQKQPS